MSNCDGNNPNELFDPVVELERILAEKDSEIAENAEIAMTAQKHLEAERDELRATVERLTRENPGFLELLAEVERLKSPVSDEEWQKYVGGLTILDDDGEERHFEEMAERKEIDALIASRSVPQEGQPASNQEGTDNGSQPAICPKCNRPHYNMEDSAACREAAPEPSKENE